MFMQGIETCLDKSNLKWLRAGLIFLTRHGSHAYGTNIETSDEDFKGVAIPPREYFHGYKDRFEQAEFREPVDMVVYDLRKFMALAADCNPNIIEVLWTDPSDYVVLTPLGRQLLDRKKDFLSKKALHTFSGYAVSQLKRIHTHYRWLKSPPKGKPTRDEFGLPERTVIPADQLQAAQDAIAKQLDRWNFKEDGLDPATRIAVMESMAEALAEIKIGADEKYLAAGRTLGFSDNFLEVLGHERAYKGRMDEWTQYRRWQTSRNPARAALEERWGYDTKHAMHLVRLMRMCREILETGVVHVRRPDAQELLAIRNGAWTYEELCLWAERQDKELKAVATRSALPHSANHEKLSRLCMELVEASF